MNQKNKEEKPDCNQTEGIKQSQEKNPEIHPKKPKKR